MTGLKNIFAYSVATVGLILFFAGRGLINCADQIFATLNQHSEKHHGTR